MILYPVASLQARQYGGDTLSVEIGREPGGTRIDSPAAPPNGMLFSIWGERTDPATTFPFSSGNREFCDIFFQNWVLRLIGWNSSAASAGDTNCFWNSNSMILADGTAVSEPPNSYVGDYTFLIEGGHTVAQLNGGVFHAFQAYNDTGGSQLVLRMWVKFAGAPVQGPYTTILSYAQLRTDLVNNGGWSPANAAAWTPSGTPTGFVIGSVYDTFNLFVTQAALEANTGTPSNAYIEAIAARTSPDPAAWGDWPITWDTGLGAANLVDQSGNGRTLLVHPGGSLYEGPVIVRP